MPVVGDLQRELRTVFIEATRKHRATVAINAAELSRRVEGGIPGYQYCIPVSCAVMKAAFRPDAGDRLVFQPAGGYGVNLTIEYVVPRPGKSAVETNL